MVSQSHCSLNLQFFNWQMFPNRNLCQLLWAIFLFCSETYTSEARGALHTPAVWASLAAAHSLLFLYGFIEKPEDYFGASVF